MYSFFLRLLFSHLSAGQIIFRQLSGFLEYFLGWLSWSLSLANIVYGWFLHITDVDGSLFAEFDTDGDGTMSQKELCGLIARRVLPPLLARSHLPAVSLRPPRSSSFHRLRPKGTLLLPPPLSSDPPRPSAGGLLAQNTRSPFPSSPPPPPPTPRASQRELEGTPGDESVAEEAARLFSQARAREK
jgi:hypothetical protein